MKIKRKKIIWAGIGIALLFLSFPIVFVAKTAFAENGHKPLVPKGYTNDASELNRELSRTENPELFHAIIGQYSLSESTSASG